MPKFRFTITEETTYNLELDQRVIDAVDDEWRASMYDLTTPEEIAAHIGRNYHNGLRLSSMDGWANMPNHFLRVDKIDTLEDYWTEEM